MTPRLTTAARRYAAAFRRCPALAAALAAGDATVQQRSDALPEAAKALVFAQVRSWGGGGTAAIVCDFEALCY